MKTNPYKTGVLSIISRIRNYNPEVGQYISHSLASDMEFHVQLTNGMLRMPPEVAHSQEVFPALVPETWIIEMGKSFVKNRDHFPIPEAKSKWKVMFGFSFIRKAL